MVEGRQAYKSYILLGKSSLYKQQPVDSFHFTCLISKSFRRRYKISEEGQGKAKRSGIVHAEVWIWGLTKLQQVWGKAVFGVSRAADLRNSSTITEFVLVGFEHSSPSTRALLFALFLALYSLAMAMNSLIIFITWTDPRLNSPMYFFLGHLSFLDVCFITTTIPQMLIHLVTKNHTVSFATCLTQMYLVFCAGVAECILLAFMAYDRYVAICHPLNYAQIMSRQVCVRLVSTAWVFGMINGIFLEYVSFRNPFCRDNHIENFFCEAPIVIALSCGDHQFIMKMIFADAIVVLLSPMALIVISYALILASILGRASSSGRGKTFSTCASHLTVVILLYTSAMFSYMNPRSTHGPDKDKPFSLLYTIITPMCNPIIYSFRNREMKGAMVRALGRAGLAQAESV
ncbi:olfactory receptor 10AD1-like [Erinaceus europaeus]|uniref:Olfactory receptor 10AD1-like n=1 Tax=Erinaceus europaeus TaxID=9365 RepID=A0ABM3XKL8_ERIEU|nr:olfactory receptor 10AD1-like [Erinaceus europaeus]